MRTLLTRHQNKINYLLVGGFNTLFGLTLFPILYFGLRQFDVHYMLLLIISQVLCVISAFFTNKYLVFKTKGGHWREFLKFSSFYMTYFVINLVATPLLVEAGGMNPAISQVMLSVGIIVSSFIWHSKITFNTEKSENREGVCSNTKMNTKNSFLSRKCPVCNSNNSECAVSSMPCAESMLFENLKSIWNGFFKDKAFFTYHRCSNCHTLYCPTFFTAGQLEALYAQMPDNTAGLPMSAMKKTQYGYFWELKKFSDLQGGYLEMGPDIGLFTENCIRYGHFSKYWLFEPNRAVWPQLQELVGNRESLLISPEMFGFSSVPDGAVNAAVMIHVLDHLLDPLSILKELRKKLAPGAIFACVTHDESSLLAKVTKSGWPPYCLQHPQLYNPATIGSLMNAAGLKVLAVQKSVNYFPATYLLKHLLWSLGLKVNIPQSSQAQLPLKLGNILTLSTA